MKRSFQVTCETMKCSKTSKHWYSFCIVYFILWSLPLLRKRSPNGWSTETIMWRGAIFNWYKSWKLSIKLSSNWTRQISAPFSLMLIFTCLVGWTGSTGRDRSQSNYHSIRVISKCQFLFMYHSISTLTAHVSIPNMYVAYQNEFSTWEFNYLQIGSCTCVHHWHFGDNSKPPWFKCPNVILAEYSILYGRIE